MRYTAVATIVTVLIALTLAPVAAQSVTTTLDANADTFVYERSPDGNRGTVPGLSTGRQWLTIDSEARSLINIDTASTVPAGASVQEVILHLTTDGWHTYDGEDAIIAMFKVDGSWSENVVTWNSMPSMGSQIGDTTYEVTGTAPDELTWDVTSVWAESTTFDFYMAMANPDTGLGIFQPYSRESEGETAPYLEISYGDDVAVPAPASVFLVPLALGAVAFFKRRREAA